MVVEPFTPPRLITTRCASSFLTASIAGSDVVPAGKEMEYSKTEELKPSIDSPETLISFNVASEDTATEKLIV